ncbi:MAG: hypothetical protein AB1453_05295 [Chloroflexota bacterium]
MPFTPYHFGPALAAKAISPHRFGFLAFVAGNVVIDLEPLYYMVTHQYPLHRSLHTLVGALLVGILTGASFLFARAVMRRMNLTRLVDDPEFQPRAIWAGALSGTVSHVLLDSLVHSDVRLFALTGGVPFSNTNPLVGWVSSAEVQIFCLFSAAAALVVLAGRWIYHHWLPAGR